MATSGTYNFGTTRVNELVDDAYERIGLIPDLLTYNDLYTAQRTSNLIFLSWQNRGLNLWTVQQSMISLKQGQAAYPLPANTVNIEEAVIRTSNRNLGGTAFSSNGGVAQNAFSGNANLACTQNAPNGYISYYWGASAQYAIQMVGVQSNSNQNYTLLFEYSLDNINWLTVGQPPQQLYPQGVNQWFVIEGPTNGVAFRVREIAGATLDIQELYFNNMLNDTQMSPKARQEYMMYSNKYAQGRPSIYYIDRQINPYVYIYLTPNSQFNNMFFTRKSLIQDIGSLQNTPQIPSRFFESYISSLAYFLAVKKQSDLQIPDTKIALLQQNADSSFAEAAQEDTEKKIVTIMIGDYSSGWGQIQ